MTKKTVNIFFIILGFIIITISTQKLLLLPLIIGLIASNLESKLFTENFIRYFIIIGILGSFTTFSAFSMEIIELYNSNKIIIAGYYQANYEVNVLKFLKEATRRKLKVALPVISSSKSMSYKLWSCKEPLYVSKFGILEPNKSHSGAQCLCT